AITSTVQKLHLALHVHHYFSGVPLDAVLLPLACLKPAFDIQLGTLTDILANNLSNSPEDHHSVPFGTLLLLAGLLVLPGVTCCKGACGRCIAAGNVSNIGIPASIADEYHFIDTACQIVLPRRKCRAASPIRGVGALLGELLNFSVGQPSDARRSSH